MNLHSNSVSIFAFQYIKQLLSNQTICAIIAVKSSKTHWIRLKSNISKSFKAFLWSKRSFLIAMIIDSTKSWFMLFYITCFATNWSQNNDHVHRFWCSCSSPGIRWQSQAIYNNPCFSIFCFHLVRYKWLLLFLLHDLFEPTIQIVFVQNDSLYPKANRLMNHWPSLSLPLAIHLLIPIPLPIHAFPFLFYPKMFQMIQIVWESTKRRKFYFKFIRSTREPEPDPQLCP